jgi:hypothetical protein
MRQTAITALRFCIDCRCTTTADTARKPMARELTIENIFDPKDRVRSPARVQSGFVWLDDKTSTWPRRTRRTTSWSKWVRHADRHSALAFNAAQPREEIREGE